MVYLLFDKQRDGSDDICIYDFHVMNTTSIGLAEPRDLAMACTLFHGFKVPMVTQPLSHSRFFLCLENMMKTVSSIGQLTLQCCEYSSFLSASGWPAKLPQSGGCGGMVLLGVASMDVCL